MELCVDQGRPLIPKFYTFLNCTFRYKYFKFKKKKKKKERKKKKEIYLTQKKILFQKIKWSSILFMVGYFIIFVKFFYSYFVNT